MKPSCTLSSRHPQEPPGTGLEYPGGQREEERSLPCGQSPGCSPHPPIRAGRLRQKLMAVPHPADLGSINLTIYTHANQL